MITKRRKHIIILLVAIMLMTTGCSVTEQSDINTQEVSATMESEAYDDTISTEVTGLPLYQEETTVKVSEVMEQASTEEEALEVDTAKDKVSKPAGAQVAYGDTIVVNCEVITQPITWTEGGESIFTVATTSKEFQSEYGLSEEALEKNVNAAIGKTVGDTFTLWFEGGDGLYGYEYTILEIPDKPADTVSYGDTIHVSYAKRSWGVDRNPHEEEKGETDIAVQLTDGAFGAFINEYYIRTAEINIAKVLGRKVGDSFRIDLSGWENTDSYQYTILGIDKAVEYGDTIRASVKQACILAGTNEDRTTHENMELTLQTRTGNLELAGQVLPLSDTKRFLKEIVGKKKEERIIFSNISDTTRNIYILSILDIKTQDVEQVFEEEILMMAPEEDIEYFEAWRGAGFCAVVEDEINKMQYCYSFYENSFSLSDTGNYSYEQKYDEKGRLIWRHISGAWNATYEYQYNADNVCIKVKSVYGSGRYDVEYYDTAGVLVKIEEYKDTDVLRAMEEYEQGIIRKRTVYSSDGNTYIEEYNEWGIPLEELNLR